MNQPRKPVTAVRLASRARPAKPDHHLTNNNGTWWCRIPVHHGPFSKRLRFSPATRDLGVARQGRDRLFAALSAASQAP